jgi:hypothetical protein
MVDACWNLHNFGKLILRFAIALQDIFSRYEIQSKDLEILSGTAHTTLFNWMSDRSEPDAHRLPLIANALDLLIADGGAVLLNRVVGAEFGPCLIQPVAPAKALQIVFRRYRMTAAQVAIAANISGHDLSEWRLGKRSPKK